MSSPLIHNGKIFTASIDEDLKGATVESYEVYRQIKEYLNTNLKELQKLSTSQLINKRYEKYRKIGQVF